MGGMIRKIRRAMKRAAVLRGTGHSLPSNRRRAWNAKRARAAAAKEKARLVLLRAQVEAIRRAER